MTPTTKRFPRSLAEAFPRQHANPIEFYPAPSMRRLIRPALCIAAAAIIGLLFAIGV